MRDWKLKGGGIGQVLSCWLEGGEGRVAGNASGLISRCCENHRVTASKKMGPAGVQPQGNEA